MSQVSATCFSSRRSDQRACPLGGVEHASAISRASTSPVTAEGTGGNARSLRPTVAHTSPPVSAYRFEIRRTESHETPTRSAITARGATSPTDVSNASSTRTRLIIDAPRTQSSLGAVVAGDTFVNGTPLVLDSAFGGCDSNFPADTPLRDLVRIAKIRWRIEHDYRELKDGLGLDHFEGRNFAGWHRHTTLASLAQAFCTLLRLDPKAPAPA